MQPTLSSPPHSQRPSLKRPAFPQPIRLRRWSLPILAAIGIGYGISHYEPVQTDSPSQIAEQERLRKNQQLMDAYGTKDNLDDLQKALDAYEIR